MHARVRANNCRLQCNMSCGLAACDVSTCLPAGCLRRLHMHVQRTRSVELRILHPPPTATMVEVEHQQHSAHTAPLLGGDASVALGARPGEWGPANKVSQTCGCDSGSLHVHSSHGA
jgi:hypothetical protein